VVTGAEHQRADWLSVRMRCLIQLPAERLAQIVELLSTNAGPVDDVMRIL
jgi:hypothetical protein